MNQHKNNSSLEQTKKEAKRLLSLAQTSSLQIQKLSDAQQIMAQLKGYPHWHAYEQQATSVLHPQIDWASLLKPNFVNILGHTPSLNWFNTYGFGCLFGRPGTGKDLISRLFLMHHLATHSQQPFGWMSVGETVDFTEPLTEMGLPILKLNAIETKAMQRSFNCFAFPKGKTTLSSSHRLLLTDFFLQEWHLDKKEEPILSPLFDSFYGAYPTPDWTDWESFLKHTSALPDQIRKKAVLHAQHWVSYFGIQPGKHYLKSHILETYKGVVLDLDKNNLYTSLNDHTWAKLFLQWVFMSQYSSEHPLIFIWNETQRLQTSQQALWLRQLENSLLFKEQYHFFSTQSPEEILSRLNLNFLRTLVNIDPGYENMNKICAHMIPELASSLQTLQDYAKILGHPGRMGTLGIFEKQGNTWSTQMGRLVVDAKQLWMAQGRLEERLYFQKLVQQCGFQNALEKASQTYPKGFIPG